MKKIRIFTGANSELAKLEIERIKKEKGSHLLLLYNRNKIREENNVTPLQVDLKQAESTKKIKNTLATLINGSTKEVSIQHFIGKFLYEPEGVTGDYNGDGINDIIYDSNVKTFIHCLDALENIMGSPSIKVKLQSIGSLSDKNPSLHNRPSFNKSKTIIKNIAETLTKKYDNINAHMISTSTVNTGNERLLRPHVSKLDYENRLSISEFRKKASPIRDLLSHQTSSYIEQSIIKPHPEFEKRFMNETKAQEQFRWDREIGRNL